MPQSKHSCPVLSLSHMIRLCFMLSSSEERSFDLCSFASFVDEFPALLYPAILTQQRMQSSINGSRFWRRMIRRRADHAIPSLNQLRQLLLRCHHSRLKTPKINAAFHQLKLRIETGKVEEDNTMTARCDEGSSLCAAADPLPTTYNPTPLSTASDASYYFPDADISSNVQAPSNGIRLVKNTRVVPLGVVH